MQVSLRGACKATGIVVALTYAFLCGCGGGHSSQSGSATAITISINPPTTVSLNSGQTQQFSASVSGSSDITVIWSCSPGGTISQSGLFTAAAAGLITIIATSDADSTKSASTTVTVTNPDADSILAEVSSGIVIMDPDGSGRRTLASQGSAPRWMADHWNFTYLTYGVQTNLILATPDGSSSSTVWSGEGYDATLSPDGSRVAYVTSNSTSDSPDFVYSVNVTKLSDGTTVQISTLTCHTFCLLEMPETPYWSPDGIWVVYSLGEDWSVHKVKADGTDDQRLFSLPEEFSYYGAPVNPSFTHDGNYVLFDFLVDPTQPSTDTIYRVDASGNNAVPITLGSQASASPDGKRIVFVGPSGLSTCNFDGTEVVAIGTGSSPSW